MSPCAGDLVYWEYPFNLGWVRSRLPVQCKCSTCIGRNPICSFTRGHRPGRLARGSGSRRYCNAQRLPLIPQISDFAMAMASKSEQASLALVPATDLFAAIMMLDSVIAACCDAGSGRPALAITQPDCASDTPWRQCGLSANTITQSEVPYSWMRL